MSQDNAEIVRELMEAFVAHDMDAFLARIDPDVEFQPMFREAEGRSVYRGHEAVREYYDTVFSTFPDMSAEIEEMLSDGPHVIARLRVSGQGTASGVQAQQVVWQVGTFRNDKAVWWAFFGTRREALEALRISE